MPPLLSTTVIEHRIYPQVREYLRLYSYTHAMATTAQDPKIRTSISLRASMKKKLKVAAATESRDMGDILDDALNQYFARPATRRVEK